MKEKLLISACLTGENCKYSGGNNALPEEQLRKLRTHYELVPVCPEQLGGLPTPRTPAERRGEQVITRAPRTPAERRGEQVITRDGRDVTSEFAAGAGKVLGIARDQKIGKALLKSRSPSCGRDRIYDGSFTGTVIQGSGVTAQLLLEHGIDICSEEEISRLL